MTTDQFIAYAISWIAASAIVAGVVFFLGNTLEMSPGTVGGLLWRSLITGAVYVGASVLAVSIPISVPFIGLAIQVGAVALCGFVLFDLSFPEEGIYAVLFAIAVQIAMVGVAFLLAILFDFFGRQG